MTNTISTLKETSLLFRNELDLYHRVKEFGQNGLLQYLHKALSFVPTLESPVMLDAGCSTGITSIELAKIYNGLVYAVDPDTLNIEYLKTKLAENPNLMELVIPFNRVIFNLNFSTIKFDLIISEGPFNKFRFNDIICTASRLIQRNGFLVVHNNMIDSMPIMELVSFYGFKIVNYIELDSSVWWYDYYSRINEALQNIELSLQYILFKKELKDILTIKNDPVKFSSAYYILQKIRPCNNGN